MLLLLKNPPFSIKSTFMYEMFFLLRDHELCCYKSLYFLSSNKVVHKEVLKNKSLLYPEKRYCLFSYLAPYIESSRSPNIFLWGLTLIHLYIIFFNFT